MCPLTAVGGNIYSSRRRPQRDRPRYDDPCAGRLHRQRRFSAPGSTLCCALRAAYGQRCYITHSDRLACHVAAPFLSPSPAYPTPPHRSGPNLRAPSSWQLSFTANREPPRTIQAPLELPHTCSLAPRSTHLRPVWEAPAKDRPPPLHTVPPACLLSETPAAARKDRRRHVSPLLCDATFKRD